MFKKILLLIFVSLFFLNLNIHDTYAAGECKWNDSILTTGAYSTYFDAGYNCLAGNQNQSNLGFSWRCNDAGTASTASFTGAKFTSFSGDNTFITVWYYAANTGDNAVDITINNESKQGARTYLWETSCSADHCQRDAGGYADVAEVSGAAVWFPLTFHLNTSNSKFRVHNGSDWNVWEDFWEATTTINKIATTFGTNAGGSNDYNFMNITVWNSTDLDNPFPDNDCRVEVFEPANETNVYYFNFNDSVATGTLVDYNRNAPGKHNGSEQGTLTLRNGQNGESNNAWHFDGTAANHVHVPNHADLDQDSTTTWLAMINVTNLATTQRMLLFRASSGGYAWNPRDLGATDNMQIYNNGGSPDAALNSNTEITLNEWNCVAVKTAPNNQAEHFINGTAAGSGSFGHQDTSEDLHIGVHANGVNYPFLGDIDWILMFNSTLSDANISYICDNGPDDFFDTYNTVSPIPPNVTLINVTSAAGGIVYNGIDKRLTGIPIATNDTTPTIRVNTDKNALCALINGDQDLNYTGIINADTAFNCTTTGGVTEHTCTLPDANATVIGLFNFSIGCKDADGNENASSSSGKFTLNITDGTTPTIDLGIENDHTYFLGDKPFTLNFTGFDNFYTTLDCAFLLNGTTNQTNSSVNNGTLTNWNSINIPSGYWTYNVTCADPVGNNESNQTNFWVNKSAPVNPTIYLNELNQSRDYEYLTTVAIVCNATNCADAGDCTDLTLSIHDGNGTTYTGNPIDVNYTIDLLREFNFTGGASAVNLSNATNTFDEELAFSSEKDNTFYEGLNSADKAFDENWTSGAQSANRINETGNGFGNFWLYENFSIPFGNVSVNLTVKYDILDTHLQNLTQYYNGSDWRDFDQNINASQDNVNLTYVVPNEGLKTETLQLRHLFWWGKEIIVCGGDCILDGASHYFEGRLSWIQKTATFDMNSNTDIVASAVNVTGFDENGYPKAIEFRSGTSTVALFPGRLHGNILNQTEFIINGDDVTTHNFSFGTTGTRIFHIDYSTGNDFRNLTLQIDGFNLDEGNSLDYEDIFNQTSTYNDTLSSNVDFQLGYFDDFENNVSGRWSHTTDDPARTTFVYSTGNSDDHLRLEIDKTASFDTSNVITMDYDDKSADLRNSSQVVLITNYYLHKAQCILHGQGCQSGTVAAKFLASDGVNTVELLSKSIQMGGASGAATDTNDINITIRSTSSDQTSWEVFENGSTQGIKDLSSLDFDKQIKLSWRNTLSWGGGPANSRNAVSRWDLKSIEWSGVWLDRNTTDGTYFSPGNVTSKIINVTNTDVSRVFFDVTDYNTDNSTTTYFVSNQCNESNPIFESVSPGFFHTFTTVGKNLCWRSTLTSTVNVTSPVLREVFLDVVPGIPNNITIDVGDDGVPDFSFKGDLNATTSPLVLNLSGDPVADYHISNVDSSETHFLLPVAIISNSSGIIQISNLQAKQNPNPITMNASLFEDCSTCTITTDLVDGIVQLDDLRIDYEGSKNITLVCSTATQDVRAYHSKFNISEVFDTFDFFPRGTNDKNLQPDGQSSSNPYWNITSQAYDKPINFTIRMNSTLNSCLHMQILTDQNYTLTTTSSQILGNASQNNITNAYFFLNLTSCDTNAFRFFDPTMCFESICESCVHTSDFGGTC